jgi:hypothetical protein
MDLNHAALAGTFSPFGFHSTLAAAQLLHSLWRDRLKLQELLPKDIHPLYVQRNPALLARVRRRQREALRDAAFLLEVRRQCDALPGVQRRSIRENLNARVARRRLVRQSAAAGSWDPFELGALTVLCCSLSRALRSPCSVPEA